IWTSAPAADGATAGAALAALETALQPLRREAEPVGALWGLTRPSLYVGRGSSHVMDPAGPRRPWLIVYPFTKTADWYLLELEERRRLMGEHIAVGREYPDIDQLLLYSHGLGDQDFVVAYET